MPDKLAGYIYIDKSVYAVKHYRFIFISKFYFGYLMVINGSLELNSGAIVSVDHWPFILRKLLGCFSLIVAMYINKCLKFLPNKWIPQWFYRLMLFMDRLLFCCVEVIWWCALSGFIFHGQLQSVGMILWFVHKLLPEKCIRAMPIYSHHHILIQMDCRWTRLFFKINYDTNALRLIKNKTNKTKQQQKKRSKGNGVYTEPSNELNMLFNSSLTINSSLFDVYFPCFSTHLDFFYSIPSLRCSTVYSEYIYSIQSTPGRFFNYAVNYAFQQNASDKIKAQNKSTSIQC